MTEAKPTPYRGRFMDEMEVEETPVIPDEQEDKTLNAEEQTWKKRHGDLRRHSQKVEKELSDRVSDLQKQFTTLKSQKTTEYPTTMEAVENWFKDYPEVTSLVQTYVLKTMDEKYKDVDDRIAQFEQEKKVDDHRKAKDILADLHDDFFDDIAPNPEFREWLSQRSKKMQDAILVENDPYAAAEVIDLYKAHQAKKGTNPNKEAAKMVKTPKGTDSPNPTENTSGKVWKESEIQKLKERDFERLMPEIELARREGRLEMDLSGGAR